MKNLVAAVCILGVTAWASAAVYTFQPMDPRSSDSNFHDMEDLDHNYYYTWGIDFSLPGNEVVTEAGLDIADIRNWQREANHLYINLLDNAPVGERRGYDGQGWSNAFDGYPTPHVLIGTWSDTDGPATWDNLHYSFASLGLLDDLTQYLANGNVGIGFDPDCHYYNNGIRFTITTSTNSVPDGGTTMMLLGGALLGLEGLRRKLRR